MASNVLYFCDQFSNGLADFLWGAIYGGIKQMTEAIVKSASNHQLDLHPRYFQSARLNPRTNCVGFKRPLLQHQFSNDLADFL